MFRNYLKIAWRTIIRHKSSTTVNILSLALGICACITIYLVSSYELSFDAFHPGKDRIYRVLATVTESTGDQLTFARVPPPVAQQGRSVLRGVETIAGVIPWNTGISIPAVNKQVTHFDSKTAGSHYLNTVIAGNAYFEIFNYHWLAGNALTALTEPFTVVLTESRARQYFGTDPPDKLIGRQVIYNDSLRVSVSGIIKDWSGPTDLSFTDFISFSTLRSSFLKNTIRTNSWDQRAMSAWVFAKLEPGTTAAQVNSQLNELVHTHADAQTKLALQLEPLSAMHFNAAIIENPIRTAHLPTLYSLMAVAAFILLLAIINFINLSTALLITRAKEAGVRKVLGSSKARLTIQFLTETLLLTCFSIVLAVALVKPVLILFRSFIPAGVSFNLFAPSTIIFLLLVTLLTSLLAGLYPAWALASFSPAKSLQWKSTQKSNDRWWLRKGLIVFQFTVSLVFIIGSLVIGNQLQYTREKDLGFTSDAIITIETPRGDSLSKVPVLAQSLKQLPGINKVALQWLSPMSENPRGMKLKFKQTDEKDFWVTQVAGNEEFIPLYQVKLLAGRNLLPADSVRELVINESLSKLMGSKDPAESLGKLLYWNDQPYPVTGVVADFHTHSLHDPITPLCIINRPDREGNIAVRLASKGKQPRLIQSTLHQMEQAWKQVYPAAPFAYRFFDESLALLYEKDQQTAMLVNTSMAVTIFISCIGLFGLTLFTVKKRAKEISIRKILGAGIINIITLLGRDFVIPVIIALFIASPIAWYFMSQWLQEFAYHTRISGWVFILAGMAALSIAVITVSFQAVKAALANPVNHLRSE